MMSANRSSLDLNKVLAGAQLPALPQSAIRLLELSQDPDQGPADFALPIESDPGLASQVLRFVNSSYFGFSREISSVRLAITLVGIRTIKNFALWSAVFSLMPNPRCGPFDLKRLWQDSLRRGLFARRMAQQLGMKEAEEPFAAALLQDMAVPLLAKELPDVYLRLLEDRNQGTRRLSDLERETFGWTHAEAATMMGQHWNLPDAFIELIGGHTKLDSWLPQAETAAAELAVALSALLPTAGDPVWTECQAFEEAYRQLCPAGTRTVEVLEQIDQQFVDMAPVLRIATAGKSLVDSYSEVAAEIS